MAENGQQNPQISAEGQFTVQVRVEQLNGSIFVVLSISCGPIANALWVDAKTARAIATAIRDGAANAETTLVKPLSLVQPS
jgi:hypothetical protein